MLFTGSGVAIITPFDKNNKINYKKFNELLNSNEAARKETRFYNTRDE